jgi:nucleoside-diphosphate-sugar epimerase
MTNLLLGATGFMGGHLVEYLFQQGEISKGVFRAGSHLKIMDSSGVQGVEADLLDHHSLHEALEGVDTVYSLASPMPDSSEKEYATLNREGIRNLLEAAREAGVMTLVHLSTLDVYGFKNRTITESSVPQPGHPYQRAKLEADVLFREFGEKNPDLKVVIVRSARGVGPRDRTVTLPILKMAEAGAVVLPPGEVMSFSHPKDVAQAMHKAATSSSLQKKLYLVKSFDTTVDDVAAAIVTATGRKAAIKRQGFRTGRTLLPSYAVEQIRASLRIQGEGKLEDLGYSPSYDPKKLGEDVAEWYRREPWATEE